MKQRRTSRRNFLKNSSLGLIGTSIVGNKQFGTSHKQDEHPDSEMPLIKEYRTLGRTGFQVSDISSVSPRSETVLRVLLQSGVNFIDTGEAYHNGNNEKLIGKVLQDFDRKKIFINS